MSKIVDNVRYEKLEKRTHRVILGLDISTTCIGASIVIDDGESKPKIVKITHVSPKLPKGKKGMEALFLRKQIFEENFISTLDEYNITDVIIEEPLITSNNALTAATLIRFNGMISESIYRKLNLVPHFISSYDSRMFSFPELCSLRQINRLGEEYTLKHIKNLIKKDHLVLFGGYEYGIDKKTVMMDMVNKMYPDIEWATKRNGTLKKENYDACDSLVCVLAYINVNRYGIERPRIINYNIKTKGKKAIVDYTMEIWGTQYTKQLVVKN